jgi:hypothetical protein
MIQMVIGSTYRFYATIIDVDAVDIEISRYTGKTWEVVVSAAQTTHTSAGDEEIYTNPFMYDWLVTGPTCLNALFRLRNEDLIYTFSDKYNITFQQSKTSCANLAYYFPIFNPNTRVQ